MMKRPTLKALLVCFLCMPTLTLSIHMYRHALDAHTFGQRCRTELIKWPVFRERDRDRDRDRDRERERERERERARESKWTGEEVKRGRKPKGECGTWTRCTL